MNGNDEAVVTALGQARDLARSAVAGGRPGGILDPRTALDAYRAAIVDCRLGQDTLGLARDELAKRLDKGLTMPGNDPVIGDLFATLLSRYEAVEDALDRDGYRRRLARWELMVVDRADYR